jgi:hypothetical protein
MSENFSPWQQASPGAYLVTHKSRGASITNSMAGEQRSPFSPMTANPLIAPSPLKDIINPQFYQNNFPAEVYIKSELGIKLDKGKFC